MPITPERIVPPVPYKTPVLDKSGFLSSAWSAWFRQLFIRVGESRALTNVELEDQQAEDLADIQADIAALQATVSSHTTLITTLQSNINDLNQGPNL